ncbi:hypothetical protein RDWZM_005133, partial [Blomia tropicalis]
ATRKKSTIATKERRQVIRWNPLRKLNRLSSSSNAMFFCIAYSSIGNSQTTWNGCEIKEWVNVGRKIAEGFPSRIAILIYHRRTYVYVWEFSSIHQTANKLDSFGIFEFGNRNH